MGHAVVGEGPAVLLVGIDAARRKWESERTRTRCVRVAAVARAHVRHTSLLEQDEGSSEFSKQTQGERGQEGAHELQIRSEGASGAHVKDPTFPQGSQRWCAH